MNKNINAANTLSASRLIFLPLLFLFVFLDMRLSFLIGYVLIGSTDFFDGKVARKFNQVTELGKSLDSIADLVFYLSTAFFIYRLYPDYLLPNIYLLYSFFGILGLSFVVSTIWCGKPIMMHTSILRFNAVMIYLLVISSYFVNTTYFVAFILVVYIIGFTEEIIIFVKYGQVDADTPSLITLIRQQRG